MTIGVGALGCFPVTVTQVEPSFPVAGAAEYVLFLSPDDSDLATLAAGSAAMAVANLQDQQPSKKWRSTSTADYVTVTFTGPVAANAVTWCAHNGSAGLYLRVRGYDSAADFAALTNVVVDTNWKSAWPLGIKPRERNWLNHGSLLRWTNDRPLQYWRIDVADGGAGQTYTEAGRLMLGRWVQPTYNLDHEGGLGRVSADLQITSDWGATLTEARFRPRALDARFSAQEQRDAFDWFDELQRLRGTAGDFVVIIDPAATTDFHRYFLHGLLGSTGMMQPVRLWSGTGFLWSFTVPVKETIF